MQEWKLYIDDERFPKGDGFTIARTMEEALTLIEDKGFPSYISFDHDLGIDDNGNLLKTGFDFAKWITEADMDGLIAIPNSFEFNVHSANNVGADNIQGILDSYLKQR